MRLAVSSSRQRSEVDRSAHFARSAPEARMPLVQLRAGGAEEERAALLPPSPRGARGRRGAPRLPSAGPRRRAPSPAPPPTTRAQRRQAANDSSSAAGSPPAPTSGAIRALSQAKSGSAVGQRLLELGLRLLRRAGLEDPALRLDDLAERPEGDPVPVGKAAPLAPAGETRSIFEVVEELGAEAALPYARLADDSDQLAGALLRRPLESADQQRLLELTPDERRGVGAGDVRSETRPRGEWTKDRQRLRFALDRNRLELLVLEDALGRPVRRLRDRDPVDRRRALQARGGVDDVAGDDAFALLRSRPKRDDRLARINADAELEGERRGRFRSAPRSPPALGDRRGRRARRRPRAQRALRRPP